MQMKIKHSDIKNAVRDYLRLRGFFVFHIHQSMGSYPGVADLVACKNGKVHFIEVKIPKGKQTRVQQIFQRDLEEQGISYIIAKSVEDVENLN